MLTVEAQRAVRALVELRLDNQPTRLQRPRGWRTPRSGTTGCDVRARPHRQGYQIIVDHHGAQRLAELLAANEGLN